ncbi:F0F1 ATP synthase subunit B [Shewanella sp. SG41-4]|uniref:F0F1 ATP synthase subunit B family protein n=1 Tax=Shewanella sp. SG41-4 TaxID=2760976 RepID=UPI00160396C1|nr:F0F1 ATP synthase subunit B [Shewanella sp. SG41-4]MBB1437171.1 F0F1 ATP synthase subunit B [Shewanella sp. SG41-4]
MLIDWFTVFAQVINFLVLVWLLKRFLYRPILNAIDAREQRIAAQIADTDAKGIEADLRCEEFQQKNTDFEQQKTTRMNQLRDETKAERARLLEAVRVESEELRRKLQIALKNEQLDLQGAISRGARDEIFSIARKVLGDLAGTTLEAAMTEVFINRLHSLNDEEVATLQSAISPPMNVSTQAILVRTAFALPKQQCSLVEVAIKKILDHDLPIRFETEPDVISGIELSINGQKISWSINEYLSSLAKRVDELLQPPINIEQAAPTQPTTKKDSHEIDT